MANNQTRVNAQNGGTKVDITHHETDSPLLPVAQIERLQQIAPDRVGWVFDQTQIEAEHRRQHIRVVRTQVFIERILGQLIAAGVCAGAFYTAYLLAMAGHELAAVSIGSTAAVGLAAAFLRNRGR